MKQSKIRTYSDLIQLPTIIERFEYLKLDGIVGEDTFGWDRYLNQEFYHSIEWLSTRDQIIIRDNGCDLGLEGYEIHGTIYVHHMNPIESIDVLDMTDYLTDPEFLICTSFSTHNAIHYGDSTLLPQDPVSRVANDTKLW